MNVLIPIETIGLVSKQNFTWHAFNSAPADFHSVASFEVRSSVCLEYAYRAAFANLGGFRAVIGLPAVSVVSDLTPSNRSIYFHA
jgi:hypothetical protein